MKRNGFTLIEMLVVISIIAILLTIILPSIGGYRARAKRAKTQNLINSLSLAAQSYKNDNKVFPHSGGMYYDSDNQNLYKCVTGDVDLSTDITYKDAKAYIQLDAGDLEQEGAKIKPYIVDAFGNRLGYYAYPNYHNVTSFNIWSKGVNGTTGNPDTFLEGNEEDDINNW